MTIQQLDPIAREYGITRTHSFRKFDLLERLFEKLRNANMLESDPVPPQPKATILQNSSPSVQELEAVVPPEPQPVSEENAQMMRAFSERSSASLKKTEASIAKVAAAQQFMPQLYSTRSRANDLAYLPDAQSDISEDSFVLDMIDPFWIHATWCLRRKTVERAKIGMGQYWYSARPMLRINVLNTAIWNWRTFHHLRRCFDSRPRKSLVHSRVGSSCKRLLWKLGYFCPVQKKI